MKLKLDDNGNAVLENGNPVYVHDDGKEAAFDAAGTVATIARLNGEAKSHRERAEAAEKAAKAYEGIDDPVAARKALETIKNIDAKQLVDAGEIDKVKAEIAESFSAKLTAAQEKLQAYEGELYAEKIGGAFTRSQYAKDRLAIPADFVQARFGEAFKIEDGQVVAYDANGGKIYSRERPGELATFDEALEVLVDAYPQKDSILRADNSGGMGSHTSAGAGRPGSTRGDFGGTREERKAAIAARFDLPK